MFFPRLEDLALFKPIHALSSLSKAVCLSHQCTPDVMRYCNLSVTLHTKREDHTGSGCATTVIDIWFLATGALKLDGYEMKGIRKTILIRSCAAPVGAVSGGR